MNFQSLVKNRSSNFVASSVSTVMILGMLSNGASGVVGNELHAALDLPKDSNVTNTAFQSLIELLNVRYHIIIIKLLINKAFSFFHRVLRFNQTFGSQITFLYHQEFEEKMILL